MHGTGHIAFGSDSVPSFDYCHRLLTMFDGSVVFIGVRSGEGAFVAGLTSSGLADLRYGAGSGASELRLGSLRESADPRGDLSSSFVRTRDGDALLSWATADELLLGRIDLNAGNVGDVTPPSSPPSSSPEPTPEPTPDPGSAPPAVSQAVGSGGGGGFSGLDLLLLALASVIMAWRHATSSHRDRSGPRRCGASPPAAHADTFR